MMIGTLEITMKLLGQSIKNKKNKTIHQNISEWEKELELLEKWLKAPAEKKEPDEDCKRYAVEEEK